MANKIKEIIKKQYPNLSGYHLSFLDDMFDYLEKANEESPSLIWTYPETISAAALNEAANKIKHQLIENNEKYIWPDDNPKDDYERGLYNAMRFLHQIINWTNPS